MICKRALTRTAVGLLACAGVMQGTAALAQDTPGQRLGLTTGFTYNTNRGLDNPSQGDTAELFTRLDFGVTFATPVQSLALSGDITLRGLDGAEAGSISDGLTDPNLRVSYAREARNARLTFTGFAREAETSTLVEELDGLDLVLVNDDATRLTYGFDGTLELGRQAPFGVTLSTGFTGLRYSDTTSTTLSDQDRFRLGAAFRFDINPVLQAGLNLRGSTFEEDGSAEGRRDTLSLTGTLTQTLPTGRFGLRANVTSVEEGERYALSIEHSIVRPLWEIGGSLGLSQAVDGDTFPIGTLNVSHELPAGALSFDLRRELRAGINDNEQEFTSMRFNYAQTIDANSGLNVSLTYRESNPTGTGGTSSLGSIGLGYERSLTRDWQMNVGLNHRINRSSAGIRAEDSQFSLSLRRNLLARR